MPNWFELPNEQLLETLKEVWYLKSPKLIGKLVRRGNLYFFIDIRSHEFRKVEYPENPYNKEIEILFSPENDSNLNLNSYYEFYIGVRDIEKRILKNRLLILFAAKKNYFELTPKPFIERRSKVYTGINIELADTIRKAIKTLTSDINREPETFIYELLQNADDYKDINKRTVSVKFTLTPNYLLLTHDGQPFNFQNVYALTGISQGDKRDNIETIGFKGIGFKSIFKDSNFAIVKSGGFEFKFDESCFPKEAKRPWQIIPVWVENYDEELLSNQDFNSAPVSIAIKPTSGDEKLREVEKSYKNILSKVFQDDRILIFLRWIDRVSISDTTDFDYQIELNKNKEKWFISTGLTDIEVEESVRNWLNKQITDEDITIPEKYENIQKTKITFAVERADSKLVGTTNSKVYNYLPTEIDFGFKFLINGDFIPDGSRTELHNNEWNNYLGKIAGKKFVEWLSVLGNHNWIYNGRARNFDRDYLNLVPNFSEPKALSAGKNTFFLEKFKEGFKDAIAGTEPISFVPTKSGRLEKLSETFIDETGLANFLKEEFFELTGIKAKLIDNEVGEGIEKIKALILEYGQGVVYEIKDLKASLKTVGFQDWLKVPSNNFRLIQHLHSIAELQSLLETEEIILSDSKQLLKSSALFSGVPNEVTFLSTKKINSELLSLLTESKITLKLAEFEPVQFFKENILGEQNFINALLINETDLLNFWRFVYDNWALFENDTTIKKSLKYFEVLCKCERELSKKIISSAYLSADFNSANEIESVVKDISPDAFFISDKYIDSKRDAEKWRKIFKHASAITDLQKVIEVLLPKLQTIEVPKHFQLAIQIFKFWKDPSNNLTPAQVGLIQANLKIKCIDNKYKKSSDCLISDHYNNNQLIASWLPHIELLNQVSKEYAPKTNQVAEWKNFLLLIGCVELNDKQNVFDAKVDLFIDLQDELHQRHFEILKSISDLYKIKKEIGLSFDFDNTLSKIKLQTTNDEWHLPNSIHLSNSYKPKLNLQADEAINSTLNFLNEKYHQNDIQKYFLTEIGVNDGFYFDKVIPSIHIDKIQERAFVSQLETIEKYRVRVQEIKKMTTKDSRGYSIRSYPDEKIRLNTYVSNHLLINYPQLLTIPKYVESFLKFVVNNKKIDVLSTQSELKIWNNNVYRHANYVAWLLQTHAILANQENIFVKPVELFSINLSNYISSKEELPKTNYTSYVAENGKSLEEVLGIQQTLNIRHCLDLLSRSDNQITLDEIKELQIVKILSGYTPTDAERAELFLLNKNLEWKPINKIFTSTDEQFQIEQSQHLHEVFYPLSDNFSIQDLSEDNLVLKTKPQSPAVTDDIEMFFRSKAKYIAFKIDHLNNEEVEAMIIDKITPIEFYEVISIAKVFPEVSPIYKKEIDFHFAEDNNKILYNGNWKTNKQVIDFLFHLIQHEKIERVWFKNLINRWDDDKLIEKLNEEVGTTPPEWNVSSQSENEDDPQASKITGSFWTGLNEDDEKFIRGIIKGDYELNEQLDANIAARIKTLMKIKNDYTPSGITNEDRFLKAGGDEILVRSAQNGLLYLDLYNWGRLNETNVRLAVYTKSEIEIYNTQEELIQFTKPQNKFGILRMPLGYGIEDYNSLHNITDKGKWHFVFIVNENTKVAQSYKEVMNLDNYNF